MGAIWSYFCKKSEQTNTPEETTKAEKEPIEESKTITIINEKPKSVEKINKMVESTESEESGIGFSSAAQSLDDSRFHDADERIPSFVSPSKTRVIDVQ